MSIPLLSLILFLAPPVSAWEIFGHCLQGDTGNCHDGSDGKICVPGDPCYKDPWVQARQTSSLIQSAEAANRCEEKKCRKQPSPRPETIVQKANLEPEYCSQGKCSPCSVNGALCRREPETLKNELEKKKNEGSFAVKSVSPPEDKNSDPAGGAEEDAGVPIDQIPQALAAHATANNPLSKNFNASSVLADSAPAGPGKAYYAFADQISSRRAGDSSAGVLLGAQKTLEAKTASQSLPKGGFVDKVLSMVWWDKGANTENLPEDPVPDAQGKPSVGP